MHGFLNGLASLLAPRRCYGCRRDLREDPTWEGLLCLACWGALEILQAACRGCGRGVGIDTARCSACRGSSLGGIGGTIALVRYRKTARRVLHRLKYQAREELGRPLGRALGERLLARSERARHPDLIVVAVPLHPLRHWRRGFNQAEAIAQGVAEVLERPRVQLLRRARATRPLFGVPRTQRDGALQGAFALRRRPPARARVLLVDDIRTSGATLRAAARALRRAGIKKIDAAVVGR